MNANTWSEVTTKANISTAVSAVSFPTPSPVKVASVGGAPQTLLYGIIDPTSSVYNWITIPAEISNVMICNIELDREIDDRWIAEVQELPGVLVYGDTRDEAVKKVKVLALEIIAELIEHDELPRQPSTITFITPGVRLDSMALV